MLGFLAKSGRSRVAGALILPTLLMHGSNPAEGNQLVQSGVEIGHDRVMIQKWDLSCGAAALGTLLRYQFGEPVTEKEIARGLMSRAEYIGHPELLQVREGFSLLDLKRFVQMYRAKRVVAKLPRQKKSIRTQVASLLPMTSRIASHSVK